MCMLAAANSTSIRFLHTTIVYICIYVVDLPITSELLVVYDHNASYKLTLSIPMPLIGNDLHNNNDSYGYHGIVHEMDAKCHMHPQMLYILFGYLICTLY